ncbi:hypothetical protein RFI_21025 [Reticulomyxa filosa]|uniref:Uncharacterized protein n=1 Tax=Reticulomyxa filosa TaxID=46433 RepID=X6MT99_RETFI|nr:hypothetical protein RFI_21025 [Reticulomyxa filosa]|eukprot:ETO16330.1 hypothetical protein RFI_21025 [Reticulomyxa filosa]
MISQEAILPYAFDLSMNEDHEEEKKEYYDEEKKEEGTEMAITFAGQRKSQYRSTAQGSNQKKKKNIQKKKKMTKSNNGTAESGSSNDESNIRKHPYAKEEEVVVSPASNTAATSPLAYENPLATITRCQMSLCNYLWFCCYFLLLNSAFAMQCDKTCMKDEALDEYTIGAVVKSGYTLLTGDCGKAYEYALVCFTRDGSNSSLSITTWDKAAFTKAYHSHKLRYPCNLYKLGINGQKNPYLCLSMDTTTNQYPHLYALAMPWTRLWQSSQYNVWYVLALIFNLLLFGVTCEYCFRKYLPYMLLLSSSNARSQHRSVIGADDITVTNNDLTLFWAWNFFRLSYLLLMAQVFSPFSLLVAGSKGLLTSNYPIVWFVISIVVVCIVFFTFVILLAVYVYSVSARNGILL